MFEADSLRDVLSSINELFVKGDFALIEQLSAGERLSAAEIAETVKSYGRTLIMPDVNELDSDVIAVNGSSQPRWSVVMPLYSEEEGKSDLSVELTVTDKGLRRYSIQIDAIRVR